jgi:hypothetical protein
MHVYPHSRLKTILDMTFSVTLVLIYFFLVDIVGF